MKRCTVCINLIGILFEKKQASFKTCSYCFTNMLSKLANENNIEKFIHLSALGIEKALDSNYALRKIDGEKKVIKNFKN